MDKRFFKTIDTEEKAYWLGFLYADGSVSKDLKAVTLELNIKDIDHIRKFKRAINSTHKITIKKRQILNANLLDWQSHVNKCV